MSVANQKVIYGSVFAPANQKNLYSIRNIEAERAAMRDLNYSGFKMWIYFSENQEDYSFDLSRAACENIGINKNSYYDGLKELEKKGYLVKVSGNGYIFHQEKIINIESEKQTVPSEKQTNMITNTEQILSEKQTPDSEIQTALSEKQTLMSEIQYRNNTDNTDNTIDNTFLAAKPQKITLKEARALVAAEPTPNCRIDWAKGLVCFSNGKTYKLEG